MQVLLPAPGDTSLCEVCGHVIVAFEHRGLIRWRHLEGKIERHGSRPIRKDPRAWIIRD